MTLAKSPIVAERWASALGDSEGHRGTLTKEGGNPGLPECRGLGIRLGKRHQGVDITIYY